VSVSCAACSRRIETARRFASVSVALVFAAALSGCSGRGTPVAYHDISAQLHGYEPPRLAREVFKNRAEFAKYLRHTVPGGRARVPSVNWARREAILVASGPRSSTGYSLHVVSLYARGGRLALTVKERTPSLGEPVAAKVTYPFVLITVPRTSKSLLLHFQGRP
jgi:protease stability complex PrcB-like protein